MGFFPDNGMMRRTRITKSSSLEIRNNAKFIENMFYWVTFHFTELHEQ